MHSQDVGVVWQAAEDVAEHNTAEEVVMAPEEAHSSSGLVLPDVHIHH